MAVDIGPDVVVWLSSFSEVEDKCNGVVCQNYVPDDKENAYVWFRMAGEQHDRGLNDEADENPMSYDFDIELCSTSLDDAVDVAMQIKAATPYRGAIGGHTAKLVMIDAHDDSYAPQNAFSDDVRHIETLLLRVFL